MLEWDMDSWQRNEMLWMDTCWFLVIFGMLLIELDLRNNSGILKRLMPPFQVHNDSIHFSLFFYLFCKICPPVCVCVCVCIHLCVVYVCKHVYKHLCTCMQRSEEEIGYPVLSLSVLFIVFGQAGWTASSQNPFISIPHNLGDITQACGQPGLTFYGGSGIQTQVLMLLQQVLLPTEPPPSLHSHLSFKGGFTTSEQGSLGKTT